MPTVRHALLNLAPIPFKPTFLLQPSNVGEGKRPCTICHRDHDLQLTEDGLHLAYVLQLVVPLTNSGL